MCLRASGEMCSISLVVISSPPARSWSSASLGVDGVPGEDRVDDDGQAERLLGLLLRGCDAGRGFICVEDRAPESVELLAFVELAADPAAQFLVGEPGKDEVCLHRPYS
jgi:hypothetical protein